MVRSFAVPDLTPPTVGQLFEQFGPLVLKRGPYLDLGKPGLHFHYAMQRTISVLRARAAIVDGGVFERVSQLRHERVLPHETAAYDHPDTDDVLDLAQPNGTLTLELFDDGTSSLEPVGRAWNIAREQDNRLSHSVECRPMGRDEGVEVAEIALGRIF